MGGQKARAEGGVRGEEHAVAAAQPRARSEEKSPLVRREKGTPADFFPLPQNLEPVPLGGAEGAFDVIFTVYDFQNADLFADVPLHQRGQEPLVLPEGEPFCVVAAVVGAFQVGKFPLGVPAREYFTAIPHRRRDVFGAAHAPLDLEGIHARRREVLGSFPHRQVGEGERIGKFPARRVVVKIFFAAGLFAAAAVARIAARERGEIALPRKAGAQRALHEHLRFDDGGNGFYLLKRRFAGKHDAGIAALLCQERARDVVRPRLRGEVQRDAGIAFVDVLTQKYILQ